MIAIFFLTLIIHTVGENRPIWSVSRTTLDTTTPSDKGFSTSSKTNNVLSPYLTPTSTFTAFSLHSDKIVSTVTSRPIIRESVTKTDLEETYSHTMGNTVTTSLIGLTRTSLIHTRRPNSLTRTRRLNSLTRDNNPHSLTRTYPTRSNPPIAQSLVLNNNTAKSDAILNCQSTCLYCQCAVICVACYISVASVVSIVSVNNVVLILTIIIYRFYHKRARGLKMVKTPKNTFDHL